MINTHTHTYIYIYIYIYIYLYLLRHHDYHLANMQFCHLLIRSSLTRPEVSLMVFPGFFYLLVCSFLVFSVICYWGIVSLLQPVSYVFLHFVQNWGYV
jgi:hypothetical protein